MSHNLSNSVFTNYETFAINSVDFNGNNFYIAWKFLTGI
jgi:hypothetical protein